MHTRSAPVILIVFVAFLVASNPLWSQSSLWAQLDGEPRSVVVGDFNLDGKPDLAVASILSNTMSILTGKGDGTFRPALNYAAGTNPQSIAVGDFNEDGEPDLAVANAGSNNVTILISSTVLPNPRALGR